MSAPDDLEISGRLQLDYATASARTATVDTSGLSLRRLRLGLAGPLDRALSYDADIDIDSEGKIEFEDIYLQYEFDNGTFVRAGQFRTPNLLDEQTSSRFTSTLERSAMTDAFSFGRQVGLAVGRYGENWTVMAGVFGDTLADASPGDMRAFAARATYALGGDNGELLHVGASARHRKRQGDGDRFGYVQPPYSRETDAIVATDAFGEADGFLGLEAGALIGPYWMSAEVGQMRAEPYAPGQNTAQFNAGYIEAGRFFGGRRTYEEGTFGRPQVLEGITAGGLGALSVVVRYDKLDLTDGPRNGGTLGTLVLGGEWWPEDTVRIGMNVYAAQADLGRARDQLDPAFEAVVAAGAQDERVTGVIARLQVDF